MLQGFEGVHTCCLDETLHTIIDRLTDAGVGNIVACIAGGVMRSSVVACICHVTIIVLNVFGFFFSSGLFAAYHLVHLTLQAAQFRKIV